MGQTKTTIELNGKLYDATTGAMLNSASPAAPVSKAAPVHSGRVVDGFFRGPALPHNPPVSRPIKVASPVKRQAHPAPKTGHKTDRSHTLMRHVVHKPETTVAKTDTSSANPDSSRAVHQHDSRLKRANLTPKSSSISRFNINSPRVSTKVTPLAVRPHPDQTAAVEPPMMNIQAMARPANPTNTTSSSFQQALHGAQSHRQQPVQSPKLRHKAAKSFGVSQRVMNGAAISLVVVLLTGFVAYQNVPSLSVKMASNQAGFHAALPGYTPSGFGLAGPIKTSPGAVTISFRSHTDNRSFQVSQKASNWTSDSLLNNVVMASNKSYQAIDDKGKTIYLYNDNTATWVNGGVWYQIAGDANLNREQVTRIADSL